MGATVAAEEAVPAELAVALTLLERPLLDASEELPALRVDPSDVIYGEPDERLAVDVLENEEHAYATVDRLLDEYGLQADRLLADFDVPLAFVAETMLRYKVGYSDGLLGDWPPAELAVFLLDWWPRKVIADPATVHATPAAVLPFLGFLDSRDSLSGASLAELADTLDELGEPFLDACEDVAGWEIEHRAPPDRRRTYADRRKRRKAARAARKRNRR
jgi:hypothetical protein